MASTYEAAVSTLYQAPHEGFVAERKRLAAELKAAGDKEAAATLAKLERPTISTWAVNQLYWKERHAFDELFSTAEHWRKGAAGAAAKHRDAATRLRNLAAKLLTAAGHAANEATLRRVSGSLAALAANGGFDPDPPGALRADRDPPGFGALEGAVLSPAAKVSRASEREEKSDKGTQDKGARDKAARDQETREEEARERRRQEEERKKRQEQKKRLEAELRDAKSAAVTHGRELERLEKRRIETEAELERARSKIEKLEAELESIRSE